jgi:hypothetical protein
MELDPTTRRAEVAAIQKHHNIFNFGRMENVWRER